MKLLSAAQIREADAYTIAHEPVSSDALMERAATACFSRILKIAGRHRPFKIFCGKGNNGGDGLVIARLMARKNMDVEVFVCNFSPRATPEFELNLARLKTIRKINLKELNPDGELPSLGKDAIVVDALLGSGLNKPAEGFVAGIIDMINRSGLTVISIDVPSGLSCDPVPDAGQSIIRAKYTLSFQTPKLSFFFASSHIYTGTWEIIPIGLHPDFLENTSCLQFMTEADDCRQIYRPRGKFSHKGNFGHALLIAGSYGKMGAAVLAAKACIRSGAGLVTAHVPGCGYQILQSTVPEVMVSVDDHEEFCTALPPLSNFNAVGIGPGIHTNQRTAGMLRLLIQECAAPMVFDADALNLLSENRTWISFLSPGSILTPHPREFDRLAGKSSTDTERFEKQKDFSFKYNVYIVLKGAHTCISTPGGKAFFNTTGNPGMATGGSGDVLTGMITALLAQSYSPFESALLGVYLHGLAGDLAVKHTGVEALTASDLIQLTGKAFRKLY